jgi:HlyD family secretion protein
MASVDQYRRRAALVWAATLSLVTACGRDDTPDAYGNFEATEVVVSAETAGRLLWFAAPEGQRLEADAVVGVVDTIPLALERSQLDAQRAAGGARAREVEHQISVLQTQLEIAERGYTRAQRLHQDQAATVQQLDQAEREYRVLGDQIRAARARLEAVRHDVASSVARIAQVDDRIQRSRITNPRAGTVLTRYAEPGEYVQPGQPLYQLAGVDSLDLRAYVTAPQLASIRLGQAAQVTIDTPGARRTLAGTVSWISAQAEFTPTPVQTREERADLVYAVKIVVANAEGVLKIGMPADVRFAVVETAGQ